MLTQAKVRSFFGGFLFFWLWHPIVSMQRTSNLPVMLRIWPKVYRTKKAAFATGVSFQENHSFLIGELRELALSQQLGGV